MDTPYFDTRYAPDPRRHVVWQAIARVLQRDVGEGKRILDVGAGYCGFINHIRGARKCALDVYDRVRQYAAAGVEVHVASCTDMFALEAESFDVVFASNLFEHLTMEEFSAALHEVWRVLAPRGKLLVMQPNFRFCWRRYFDDYTHRLIFTDAGLSDALHAHGFDVEKVVPRLLPLSFKSRGPAWPWLLRLYLASPLRPFAAQMYLLARKRV